jgi:signal transduction histidine kinase
LASKLTEVITLPEAMKTVMQELSNTLHLKYATAYILQLGAHNIYSIHQIVLFGNISAHKASLQQDDLVIQYFVHHPSIETIEALNRSVQVEKKLLEKADLESNNPSSADILIREHALKHAVITKFNELGVRAAIPIHINNQLASLILLGNRLSGDRLNSNDLNLLEGVRSQAVIAIQKAKLYEGDQMKSEFVSVASHELLTPIAAMEGYLNMIMSDRYDGQIDEQAKDYISKVYSSTHRLGNLVKDLLSVSRIESGAMSFNIQSVNVDSIIQDAVDQLEITAKNKGLSLAYLRTKNPVPNILVDSERTTQILINLIGNAVKYTPSGSVTITTSVDNHKKFVWIHVTDTGLGISKKDQEHLFQKFYRVDTPDRTGIVGTGLGLYLIKSMAEKMGGEIAVKSSVGEGSTFSCGLPYTLATHTEN